MIKVVDDFLPQGYIDAIETLCYSKEMSWSYVNETVYGNPDNTNVWEKQFSHSLFFEGKIASEHYKFFMPVMFLLEKEINYKVKSLLRLKLNLLTTVPDSNSIFVPHIDSGDIEPYLSAVLHINNSDGDTIIYENAIEDRSILNREDYFTYLENRKRNEKFVIKEQVEFRKNRIIIFDGSYLHEAKWPERHKDRLVLNIVFR